MDVLPHARMRGVITFTNLGNLYEIHFIITVTLGQQLRVMDTASGREK